MPTIGSWYKTLLKKAEENTDENYTFHYSYLKKVMKQYVRDNVNAKMPKALREVITDNNLKITKVYKTPYDDAINCKVMLQGYFTNENGKKTPVPLVANLFEYGRSNSPYPKHPFMRSSFNKSQIEQAMLKVQNKYIKGD